MHQNYEDNLSSSLRIIHGAVRFSAMQLEALRGAEVCQEGHHV